jgi:hypothetical protein
MVDIFIDNVKIGKTTDKGIGIDFGTIGGDRTTVAKMKPVKLDGIIELEFCFTVTHQCTFCGCFIGNETDELVKCPNGCEGLMKKQR